MLVTGQNRQRKMEFVLIDDLMPQDHLLRKIDKYIDFSFIVVHSPLSAESFLRALTGSTQPVLFSSFEAPWVVVLFALRQSLIPLYFIPFDPLIQLSAVNSC